MLDTFLLKISAEKHFRSYLGEKFNEIHFARAPDDQRYKANAMRGSIPRNNFTHERKTSYDSTYLDRKTGECHRTVC